MDNSIQTLFETAEDVARWLEDQGFSPETTGAFIVAICFAGTTVSVFFFLRMLVFYRPSHGR